LFRRVSSRSDAAVAEVDSEKQRMFAIDVVRKLRAAGFEALWAGGCVRDQLLGRQPKDYDVATTARPEQIRQVFGHRRTVAVGAAFGVITVLGPKHAGQLEVATFRQDKSYSDGRHPDAVEFSTPRADAQRRDFTINGLFFDPLDERVIDYVGGQDDLARGIVRAIGEPRARFGEDKLRLLRAVRFTAALAYLLDPATRDAVEAMSAQVTQVSAERIAAEVRLMLIDRHRARAVDLLHEVGLLEAVLPELAVINQADSLTVTGRGAEQAWVTTLNVLDCLDEPSFPLALAALVHGFVSPEGCRDICRRWKLSNRDTRQTTWLVEQHTALVGARHMAWPRLQRLLIAEEIGELLSLSGAIATAGGQSADDVSYCREKLLLPPERLNPPPLVSGDDLIAHGVARGKRYHVLLEAVRDAQLESSIATKAEALELIDRLLGAEPPG
jgi:tRNA nucleotidyltransferase/poly(A) polymerase